MSDGGKLLPYAPQKGRNFEEQLPGVFFHRDFYNDWIKLFPDKGKREKPRIILGDRIKIAMEEKMQCPLNWFKILHKTSGMCRIAVNGEVNLRVLLVFRNVKGVSSMLILTAFAEKDKKRGGGSSYTDAAKIAEKRLRDFDY